MFKLNTKFFPAGDQAQAIEKLTQGLTKYSHQLLHGITGSGKTYTMANVIHKLQEPTLIIAPNKTLAAQLYQEMKSFFPENAVEYFVSSFDYYQPESYVASSDLYIEKTSSINEQIERMRLSSARSVLERKDVIIVATVSVLYGYGDATEYLSKSLQLQKGHNLLMDDLLLYLQEAGYQAQKQAGPLKPRTFQLINNGIILHQLGSEFLLRILLDDNIISDISLIHPEDYSLVTQLGTTTIYHAENYSVSTENRPRFLEAVKAELSEQVHYFLKAGKPDFAKRLQERTLRDLELIKEVGFCKGMENYVYYMYGQQSLKNAPTSSFLHFFAYHKNRLIIVDESHITMPQIAGMYKANLSRKENLVAYGFRLPSSLFNRPLKIEEFESLATKVIYISATPATYELEKQQQIVEQIVRPTGLLDPKIDIRSVDIQITDMIFEVKKVISRGDRAIVAALTKKTANDIADFLCENGIKACYLHCDVMPLERIEIISDLRKGIYDVVVGINMLREGIDLPEASAIFILDACKEGFLRSKRSLMQMVGRVARNQNGLAIIYASKKTEAIEYTYQETIRRRAIQEAYNQQYGITPLSIKKDIQVSIQNNLSTSRSHKLINIDNISNVRQAKKHIIHLEALLKKFVDNLEFEQADILFQQIRSLQEKFSL